MILLQLQLKNMIITTLPVSKSILIRKLLIHYLYFDEIMEIPADAPRDVQLVHENLGRIRQAKAAISTTPTLIDVQDCGAAYRFFLPLLCLSSGNWLLTGTERLLMRPVAPLVQTLQAAGASIERTEKGWLVKGRHLETETLSLEASLSSQFVSALLLVAPLIRLKTLALTLVPQTSKHYIDLTIRMLQHYGIEIRETKVGYEVRQMQFWKSDFVLENDWSAAAYWYAVAALTDEEFFLPMLFADSLQPDSAIVRFAKKFWNVESRFTPDGVRICSLGKTFGKQPAVWECSNTPDLIPIVAVMSVLTKTEYQIEGCESLNRKESKRLDALSKSLSAFVPVEVSENQHLLKVQGNIALASSPLGKQEQCLGFDACADHRLVMAYSLFGLFQPVEIRDFESVKKSYPLFNPFYNF